MSVPQDLTVESLASATEYPVGLVFDVALELFAVRLSTLPNSELNFQIADGPFARSETVTINAVTIRPGVFLVSWQEASRATVVHVEDFVEMKLHSHATLADGTFLRMQGPMRIAGPKASK